MGPSAADTPARPFRGSGLHVARGFSAYELTAKRTSGRGRTRLARVRILSRWRRASALRQQLRSVRQRTITPPDEPADKLYNEGLYLLNDKQDSEGRGQEVRGGRPPASLFGMGAQVADHVGLRLLSGRRIRRLRSPPPSATSRCIPAARTPPTRSILIGSSYYDEIPDVTRDQARTEKALAALEEVIRKYPTSEYAVSAKHKIEMARDQLAGKEMEIGRYYLEQARTTPARSTASRSWSRSTRPRATSRRR